MDGGLFNSPRSTDRRAVNRPAVAQRPPEATPAPAVSESPHRPAPKKANKPSHTRTIIIVAAIVLLLAGAAVWFFVLRGGVASAIQSSKYQAVFFTNGQVYFGKLSDLNGGYLKLKDIYYLQTQSTGETDANNPQETASNTQAGVELIKLGNEVHGPEDEMILSKDQVLFIENLKSDGKVSQKIDEFKKQ